MYSCRFLRQGVRRSRIVTERLLHHDASRIRQASLGQALDDRPEQERRDLEIEDGIVGALDHISDPSVSGRVGEVPAHVRQARRETVEDGWIELLAGPFDRLPCALHQLLHCPVVDGDADDRALQ